MGAAVLEAVDLCKTYEGDGHAVQALKNVSFQMKKGEYVVIMGTSGSGKSTLLNLLGALDKPTSGTVRLNGEEHPGMFEEPEASLYRRKNIGFVFQSYQLLKDLSAEDNLAVPLILSGEPEDELRKKVNDMLDLLDLRRWRRHRPVQLSGGQQQRIAIGRALIGNPPILLADEPTGNLDYNTSKEILDLLLRMRETFGQTILLVTHNPVVAATADRVLFFHDGRIREEYRCRGKRDLERILDIFKTMNEAGVAP